MTPRPNQRKTTIDPHEWAMIAEEEQQTDARRLLWARVALYVTIGFAIATAVWLWWWRVTR